MIAGVWAWHRTCKEARAMKTKSNVKAGPTLVFVHGKGSGGRRPLKVRTNIHAGLTSEDDE
jgi:hypothetical protein